MRRDQADELKKESEELIANHRQNKLKLDRQHHWSQKSQKQIAQRRKTEHATKILTEDELDNLSITA
jgi:hypothetical protein